GRVVGEAQSMNDEDQLSAAVQRVIDKHLDVPEISPSWIATQVMVEIEFPRTLHALGYIGCHLQVRQLARHKLRRRFDPRAVIEAAIEEGEDLFPETLQERYPRRSRVGEEPVYVFRTLLADDDLTYNVERMRRGGRALLKHADALEAWGTNRRRSA